MSGKFDIEMANLKNEILALKSWSIKNAQQLRTTSIVVPVTFTLGSHLGVLRATQSAWITITPISGTMPIISATIDITDTEDRNFFYEGELQQDGTFIYEFFVNKTSNPSDAVGTTLNYNLVFTSTSQMSYDLEYQDE